MEKTIGEELAELVVHEEDEQAESSPESQPEKDKTEPTPSQEEPEHPAEEKEVPFHKHPRWKRLTAELEELRSFKEEQEKKAKEVSEKPVPAPISQVPPQYQKLFGDDVDAYNEWRSVLKEEARHEAEQVIQERYEKERQEEQRKKEAEIKAVSWAEDQFQELTDELGVDFTDKSSSERNQILDICEEYGLFTPEGFPNIRAANNLRSKLFPVVEPEEVEEKKKIVSKTNAKSNVVKTEPDVWTPSSLRKKSMAQFFK